MVKTISVSLIFLWIDRDLLSLFGRGVRILYTLVKVDIHPRTPPSRAKLKSIVDFIKSSSLFILINLTKCDRISLDFYSRVFMRFL